MAKLEFQTEAAPTSPTGRTPPITDEQLATLKEGIGNIVPIPWPANPRQWVGMRCLSRAEDRFCYLEAIKIMDRMKLPAADPKMFDKICTDLILHTSLRDCIWVENDQGELQEQRNNPATTLILTADRFAEVTTEQQVSKLTDHYNEIMMASAPLTRFQKMIQGEEFQKAWDELKKKPDANHLIGSSYKELVALLSFIGHLFADPPENSAT